MRYLLWVLKFLLFVLVITFAVKNTDPVTVRYTLGGEWQAPLVFVLLVAFCVGVAAGLGAGLTQVFRQRREIATLRRELGRISPGGVEGTEKTRPEGNPA
ncbi:MAG: lipopolysaccharide assembly protein LapA domain-containing protein [Pseudomonadota bacterium]